MSTFFDICKENTMVDRAHLPYLEKIINEINISYVDGAIVECGVWKGGCVMWMMYCQNKFNSERQIYLYDTFTGMTFPGSEKDDPVAVKTWKDTNDNKYHREYDKWHGMNKWAYCPLDMVKNNIDLVKYDPNKVHYVIGDICETLNDPKNIPNEISILRLDTDWYSSTKKELDVLFPKVSYGGYIIIDDYYVWKGSKIATDEFLSEHRDIQIVDEKLTGKKKVFKKI